MIQKRNSYFIYLLLITTFISFCGQSSNAIFPANENKETEDVISVGFKVYEANCIKCHKADLKGAENWKTDRDEDGDRLAPPLNGYGHSWHHSPEQIFNTIRFGLVYFDQNYKGKMKGNDQLSDGDVLSILEYIKSVWPESIQKKYKTMTKH